MDNGKRVLWGRRIVRWAIPGVLVAGLVWSFIPRSPRPAGDLRSPAVEAPAPAQTTGREPPPPRARGASSPYGEIHLGNLVGTDAAGRKRWQIVAEQVTLAQGRDVVLLRDVQATFYSPDGVTMEVTGHLGRYDTGTRDVDLEGDVHGVSSAGRELFADRLHYSPASDEVTGTGHIRVFEKRVIMHADRMISNPTLGQTRFFGHVHITSR